MATPETEWVGPLLDRLLKRQGAITGTVPVELRLEGRGRKGRLVIRGAKTVTSRYFRWTGNELTEETDGRGCYHVIDLHEDTLLDIALGEVDVRTAVAAGLVSITGDRALYHREEILRIISQLGNWIQQELSAAGQARAR